MTANDNKPQRSAPSNPRGNVVALVVVVVIAAALFWVVSAIHKHNDVQDCLDSGRHDCVDLEQQGH